MFTPSKPARGQSVAAAPAYTSDRTLGDPAVSHPAPIDPHRAIHDLINDAIHDLGVVCVGVEGDRLFFEAYGSSPQAQQLIPTLIQRLERTPEPVRSVLRAIKSISLTVRQPG